MEKVSFELNKKDALGAKKQTVFVAMSGGVDSSVAALLLKKQGYEVIGVFMKCWSGDVSLGMTCAWERESEDARRVAGHLNIPFYVWDFENEYKRRVVDYMIEGYRAGITPNPDVMCNREIKFGIFLEKALAMGADFVSTGHYVRLVATPKRKTVEAEYYLFVARDASKDQSYFLWTLTQKQLRHCLFPIGEYEKSEIRKMAKAAGLPTAAKKDSQGICFLGKITIEDFLKTYIPEKEGIALDAAGTPIGMHTGVHFYTIGQRHGLASGNWQTRPGVKKEPLYVAAKDIAANTLTVVPGNEHRALYQKEIHLTDVNLIAPMPDIRRPLSVRARVRYRQPLSDGKFTLEGDEAVLVFQTPQKFVAVGQSVVFYAKDGEMLGGGIIKEAK